MGGDGYAEQASAVDRTADEIRRSIFAGQLTPGTPLREVALSEAMGVGRSSVREALAVLVAEGIVVRIANRGAMVKEITPADVTDVSRARMALETAGVHGWRDASEEQRGAVRRAVDEYAALAAETTDPAALTAAHLRIHRALVGLTGSQRLLATADAYGAELRLGLAHLDRVRGNLREQVASHQVLIALLEDGQLTAGAAELASHLAAAEVSLRGVITADQPRG